MKINVGNNGTIKAQPAVAWHVALGWAHLVPVVGEHSSTYLKLEPLSFRWPVPIDSDRHRRIPHHGDVLACRGALRASCIATTSMKQSNHSADNGRLSPFSLHQIGPNQVATIAAHFKMMNVLRSEHC